MANGKYIIRTHKSGLNKNGKSIIFYTYRHGNKTTLFSSGRQISPEHWDKKHRRIKASYKGSALFNMFLDKLRAKIEDHVHMALIQGVEPSVAYLREKIRQKKEEKSQQVEYVDFFSFVKQFIENSKINKARSTIIGYNNTYRHYKNFEKYRGQPITWQDFDMNFYDSFKHYMLVEQKVSDNTFGKQIKTLKTFLNEAIERGHNVNPAFRSKKFKVLAEDAENIYLSEHELKILIDLDLSHNPRLDKVRDLFIVGCFTGLRFSDFSEIKPENIKENYIQIRTRKTNQIVVIPYHPYVKQIMKKYDGKYPNSLPPSLSNQKMNDALKLVGESAKLNESIITSMTKGGSRVETIRKKHKLIMTHTARRSFATNLFKQGFPAINIMKITGHKTEKAFMKYIKINEKEAASMLQTHWDRYYTINPINPEPILKVA